MSQCPVCDKETTVHHQSDGGLLFLLCGHTAIYNPVKDREVIWHGFKDNIEVDIDFTGYLFVPAGNMHLSDVWTANRCPVCFDELKFVSAQATPDGIVGQLQCSHTVRASNSSVALFVPEPLPVNETYKPPVENVLVHQPGSVPEGNKTFTSDNVPERGSPTDVAREICPACGTPSIYKLQYRPQGIVTCGHGYIKYPNKPARLI